MNAETQEVLKRFKRQANVADTFIHNENVPIHHKMHYMAVFIDLYASDRNWIKTDLNHIQFSILSELDEITGKLLGRFNAIGVEDDLNNFPMADCTITDEGISFALAKVFDNGSADFGNFKLDDAKSLMRDFSPEYRELIGEDENEYLTFDV